MIKAVYAGSFDPVTNGHVNIIARAARLFGELTVLVMKNGQKTPLLTVQERCALLQEAVADIPGVRVEAGDGLLADYAQKHGVTVLVRGLRGDSDLEPEFAACYFNKQFCPSAETVFLATDVRWKYVSSSAVKEAARCGGDVSGFVPEAVAKTLQEKFK